MSNVIYRLFNIFCAMAEPTIFDVCFDIDVHVCCLGFLVQFYWLAVLLLRLLQNCWF